MDSLRISRLLVALAIAGTAACAVSEAHAAGAARPPVTWLKGEGNFTKAHRAPQSIENVVVHVTEGSFWGSVTWLKNPRAHASSHFVVSRAGRIVQLVHVSDIAWHAGNWRVNTSSVGIEHEGFTYGPNGFTTSQYRNSAKLTAWLARRALMPIDREHIIGHAEVPAPGGGRGGASGHSDPGPSWNWTRYLRLVRSYAGVQKLSVAPLLPRGPLRGVVPWRAKATGGISRVEFSIDGRVVWTDRRAPFAYGGGRGLNTTRLGNGRHVLEVHGVAGPGRYDIARTAVVVDNRAFALTTAGARPWSKARGLVRLRVRPWGARAARMSFTVDGRRAGIDRRPPFVFRWRAARAKPGKHVLEIVATSVDGRVATRRIPVVVPRPKLVPRPKPPTPQRPAVPPLSIVAQSVRDGQEATGLVVWSVDATSAARVEFLVDGIVRGTDVAAPYRFGWNAAAEAPGDHRLTARAVGAGGKLVERSVVVTVPAPTPETSETAAP
jgi:N-acetylmuramoyl-L-alanine amidase/Bacterial Ig domain